MISSCVSLSAPSEETLEDTPPPPPGGGGGVWAVGMGNLCPYNNTDRHIFTQNIHTFMHTYGGNTS